MPSLGKEACQLDVEGALAGIKSRTGYELRGALFLEAGVRGYSAGALTPGQASASENWNYRALGGGG